MIKYNIISEVNNNMKLYTVSIVGNIGIGSASNGNVAKINNAIKKEIINDDSELIKKVIFDFTEFVYEFGDSIASLWLFLMKANIESVIVAKNGTSKALSGLLQTSIPVKFFDNIYEAKHALL